MREEKLEVFSEASNLAIVRPPGRKFPGVVIQGDSLSNLCSCAIEVARRLPDLGVKDEAVLGAAEELVEGLVARMLHYQDILDQHGIALPYSKKFSGDDMLKLLPDDDCDSEEVID